MQYAVLEIEVKFLNIVHMRRSFKVLSVVTETHNQVNFHPYAIPHPKEYEAQMILWFVSMKTHFRREAINVLFSLDLERLVRN
jgi:hypothetical protein